MEDPLRWLGLDVHKHYVLVVEMEDSGGAERSFRFALPEGLTEFCQQLDQECQVVMEASTSTFRLAEIIADRAGRVVVADPSQTRGVLPRSRVNDHLAAQALARLLRSQFVRPVWVPPTEIRDLRQLVAHHQSLSHSRTRLVNRLRSLLSQELVCPPRELLGRSGRGFLDTLFPAQPGCRLTLCGILRQLDQVDGELMEVERALESFSRRSPEAGLLMTIPGLGPIFAAILMSQIGDVRRFASPRQLCAYAGLVPRVYESGLTRRMGHLSKAGAGHTRSVLTLVSWYMARKGEVLAGFRNRLLERKPKSVVHAAVARKLLVIIWSMLTHQRSFREQDEKLTARKVSRLQRGLEPSLGAFEVPPKPPRPKPASSRRPSPDDATA